MKLSTATKSSPSTRSTTSTAVQHSRSAQRTYSRRVSSHVQKRKAEAAKASSDDESLEGDLMESLNGSGSLKKARMELYDEDELGSRKMGRRVKGRGKREGDSDGSSNGRVIETLGYDQEGASNIIKSPTSPLTTPSRSPSPSPSARRRVTATASDSKKLRAYNVQRTTLQAGSTAESGPDINIIPATSMVSIPAALSTPLKPSRSHLDSNDRQSPSLTTISPAKSDDSMPQSHGSGTSGTSLNRPPRPAGMRRMLTKTQSLGHAPTTPSKLGKDRSSTPVNDDIFGASMTTPTKTAPSTPSRGLGRTTSLPDNPSRQYVNDGTKGSPSAGHGTTLSGLVALPIMNSGGSSGGRAQRTYGRNRSFLAATSGSTDTVEDEESMESVHSSGGRGKRKVDDDVIKESYAELRKRFEVDNSVGDSSAMGGSGSLAADLVSAKAPQPVSDMRSKGENRRFMDEIGFMVDGITDPSTNLAYKQASSTDILVHLRDEVWMSKMKLCGQIERIWDAMLSAGGTDGDHVMDVICLIFLATLIQAGSDYDLIFSTHGVQCIEIVLRVLQERSGALDGLASSAKPSRTLQKLRTLAEELDVGWAVQSVPCTRRLASFVLSTMIRHETWPKTRSQTYDHRVLKTLLESFNLEIRLSCDRFDLYEMGLSMSSTEEPADLDHLFQCLQIMSSAISGSPEERDTVAEDVEHLPNNVMSGIMSMTTLTLADNSKVKRIAAICAVEGLQILANMANVASDWTEPLTNPNGGLVTLARILLNRETIVRNLQHQSSNSQTGYTSVPSTLAIDETEPSSEVKDIPTKSSYPASTAMTSDELLCVVLALLTTTVLSRSEAAEPVAMKKISGTCSGQERCLKICKCEDVCPLGKHLVDIYLDQLKLGDEPNAGVLTGYLALLLSKLITNSPMAKNMIVPLLPGSDLKAKIEGLKRSLKELTELQSVVTRKLRDMADTTNDVVEESETGENKVDQVVLTGPDVFEKDSDVLKEAVGDLDEFLEN